MLGPDGPSRRFHLITRRRKRWPDVTDVAWPGCGFHEARAGPLQVLAHVVRVELQLGVEAVEVRDEQELQRQAKMSSTMSFFSVVVHMTDVYHGGMSPLF